MVDAALGALRVRLRNAGSYLVDKQGRRDAEVGTDVDGENGDCATSTGAPGSGSGPSPAAIPASGSLSLSLQLPSTDGSSEKHSDGESFLVNKCEPFQAPVEDRAGCDELTRGQLHDQCSRRGFEGGLEDAINRNGRYGRIAPSGGGV